MNVEPRGDPARLLIRGATVLSDPRAEPRLADITISGSRISAVGAAESFDDSVQVIEASDHLVIPGLVNGHTHAHNNLSKGAIDGFPLEIWLQYLVARLGRLSPREIYVSAAIGAIEMAKSGVTCACDMAQVIPWPDEETMGAVLQAYADVGLRVACSAQVFDLPFVDSMPALRRLLPDEASDLGARVPVPRDEVLDTLRAVAKRWHGAADGRIRFGIGVNQVCLCSDAFLGACADLARELGLGIQTHLVETRAEALSALDRFGMSATAKLSELGLLGERSILAHAVWVSDDDLELIAQAGSSISYNPLSNLKLGSGLAPLTRMRDVGCNVALGTDGSASSDNQNLFAVIRIAALLSRVSEKDHRRWLTPADSLDMAISGGARAAGFAGEIGQVAPGFAADLVLIDLSTSYFHPRNDLVSQLVHCEVGSSVATVVIDGRVVVRDGRVVTVDESALLAEATETSRRISATSAGRAGPVPPLVPYIERALADLDRVEWQPRT